MKIAYIQVDGLGELGQIFSFAEAKMYTFSNGDNALAVEITDNNFHSINKGILSDATWWNDHIGSTFYVSHSNLINERLTLRLFIPETKQAVFWIDRSVTFGSYENSFIALEDHFRICTNRPKLEKGTINIEGTVYALPEFGKETLRKFWLPILSDFSSTLGQKIELRGGVGSSDGFTFSIIQDQKYKDYLSYYLRTFSLSTSESQNERPLIYRKETTSSGKQWLFTNEKIKDFTLKPERIYDPTEFFLSEESRTSFRIFEYVNAPSWSDDIIYVNNSININDEFIYTAYPMFTQADEISNLTSFFLRNRGLWVNNELMHFVDVEEIEDGGLTINKLKVRRGTLNTKPRKHDSQSAFYNFVPNLTAQRIRFFTSDNNIITNVNDKQDIYRGIISEISSSENLTTLNVEITTDIFSIYAAENSAPGVSGVATITGRVEVETEEDVSYNIRTINNLNATNLNESNIRYTGTLGNYSSDDVWSLLGDVTYDKLKNDNEFHAEVLRRTNYFWRWIVDDDNYYRVANSFHTYPHIKMQTANNNNRYDIPLANFPFFPVTINGLNDEFVYMMHTPIHFSTTDGAVPLILTDPLVRHTVPNFVTNKKVAKDSALKDADIQNINNLAPRTERFLTQNPRRNYYLPQGTYVTAGGVDEKLFPSIRAFPTMEARSSLRTDEDTFLSVIPKYRETPTELGHVFEPNYAFGLAWSNPSFDELLNRPRASFGSLLLEKNSCIVHVAEAILQLLTSTGFGNNTFKNVTSPYYSGSLNWNFDVLPIGLGLGIPAENIDINSFFKYVFDESFRRRVVFLRNFCVKSSEASDKKKIMEEILKPFFLSISTNEKGLIQLTDAIPTNILGVINDNDIRWESQPEFKNKVITNNITESIVLNVLRPSRGDGLLNIPVYSFYPFPIFYSEDITVETTEELKDQNGDELLVYDDLDRREFVRDSIKTDIYDAVKTKPIEIKTNINIYDTPFIFRNFNNKLQDSSIIYIKYYSRPTPEFTFSLDNSFKINVGELWRVNLRNFPSLLGRKNSDNIIGVVNDIQIDIINNIKTVKMLMLSVSSYQLIEEERWTAAATISIGGNSNVFTLSERTYLERPYTDSSSVRGPYIEFDINLFKPGDVVDIYDKYYTYKTTREIVAIEGFKIELDQVSTLESGDIIQISEKTLQQQPAELFFHYQNTNNTWK